MSIIPYLGIHFSVITRPFLSNQTENFLWRLRYYLSIGDDKSWFWCFLNKKFVGKKGVAATLGLKGLGPQYMIKSGTTEWTSWVNHYLKKLFSKFLGLNLLLQLLPHSPSFWILGKKSYHLVFTASKNIFAIQRWALARIYCMCANFNCISWKMNCSQVFKWLCLKLCRHILGIN